MKTSLQIEDRQRFLKYNTENNIILKSEKLNFKSSPQKKIWLENKKSKKKKEKKRKSQAAGWGRKYNIQMNKTTRHIYIFIYRGRSSKI